MIDTVDRLLKSTLDALCPNVARLFFRGKAGTYITYQLVSSEDMAAADDETHGTEYTYRVDIYSKRDYIALLRRVKQALKAAGFYGLVIDPEVYERDTGFYKRRYKNYGNYWFTRSLPCADHRGQRWQRNIRNARAHGEGH